MNKPVTGTFTVGLWDLLHKQETLGSYDRLLDWMLEMAELPLDTQGVTHRAVMVDVEEQALEITVEGWTEV